MRTMPTLLESVREALADRYSVEREVGEGAMATVFLAQDRKYDRLVAIKVLHPELATACAAERFLREIRITAQLQHSHIVPLLDSGEAGGFLYSVMPFIEGESLRERLMAERRLPLSEAVTIAREVADALEYAHGRGVVHRDIKPENILLAGHPSRPGSAIRRHAMVTDFGIARAIKIAAEATLTAAGIPIGTATYMSPEQALGSGEVDGRADVYSLGVTLYEMLAGHPPFVGSSLRSILTQHIWTDPPPLSAVRPDVPAEISDLVRRAMAKAPEDRFQTAGEMLDQLTSCFECLPIAALPADRLPPTVTARLGIDAPARARRLASRSGLWLAAAVAGVALAVGLWLPGVGRLTAGPESTGPYQASVAVLPFDNLGGGDAYFSDGITEEIISKLAQVDSLKVISRTSVVALRRSNLTLPQIADTLGVRHVVEGSVRRTGDRVRVTVQLIEAKSDAHLWSATYDRQLTDSLQVQEEIARQVSGMLLKSIRGMRPLSPASRTAEAPAYDAYLRGNALLQRRSSAEMLAAMEAYHEALALDSTYAPAYAGLSRAYATWVLYGFRGGPDRYAAAARALALAERALALDPGLAEAHHARADALGVAGASSDQLREQTRRALDLMPGSAELRMAYAHTLAQANRYRDALAHARRALDLDPLSLGLRHSVMAIAVGARRHDVVLREVERNRARAPQDPVAGVFGAFALLLSGRPEQCLTLELGPWVEIRALCLQALGKQRDAMALVDSLSREFEAGRYHDTYQFAHLAAFYARQGDVERALRWLEKGAALTPVMSYWELSSGLFGPAVRDPRFRTGLVRIRRAIAARLEEERRRTGSLLLEPLPRTAA